MTTPRDLSGTWSVAAFYRAIALAHLDLDALGARCGVDDFCCVPTLTACGALPPGWPEAVAHRLVRRMIAILDYRGTVYDRDAFVTDAEGRIVYQDGWDDLRAWAEALGCEEGANDESPGSLVPVLFALDAGGSMDALLERLGPDRMAAFVTRLRQEDLLDDAAALGWAGGQKFEDVALLAQADGDEAEARAEWARVQAWVEWYRLHGSCPRCGRVAAHPDGPPDVRCVECGFEWFRERPPTTGPD